MKAKYSRDIPLNSDIYWWLIDYLPRADYGKDKYGERLFPKLKDLDNGGQAAVLRMFCESQGLKSIKYHTLKACWATEVLRSGVPATDLMLMGGWRDYKTMMIYIRLAGMETVGATEGLNFDLASSTQNLNMSATQWSKFDNIFSKDKEKKSTPEKEVVSELLPDNVINLFG